MPSYQKNPKTKLWSVRYTDVRPDGTTYQPRLSGKFKTKKEAQYAWEDFLASKKEREEKARLEDAAKRDPENITFDSLTSAYFEYLKPRVRESSFYGIERNFNAKITPFFSGMKLKDITPAKIKTDDSLEKSVLM